VIEPRKGYSRGLQDNSQGSKGGKRSRCCWKRPPPWWQKPHWWWERPTSTSPKSQRRPSPCELIHSEDSPEHRMPRAAHGYLSARAGGSANTARAAGCLGKVPGPKARRKLSRNLWRVWRVWRRRRLRPLQSCLEVRFLFASLPYQRCQEC
jgi:hypothetical protein